MSFAPGPLFASLFVSSIGAGLFIYGKKQERIPQLAAGVVLSIYPYFVTGVAWMFAICVAILVGLTLMVRSGH
jgi:hypothetical protein